MPRKLKTYTTSIGFYDLAVAAPSMKAALEAWGSPQNLFHQGLARETDDPDVAAAAESRPGIVLRRAVGTSDPFREHAPPPRTISGKAPNSPPARPKRAKTKAAKGKGQKVAIISFDKARAERERQRQAEEAQRVRERAAEERAEERRARAIEKAQADLDRAEESHRTTIKGLEDERAALDSQIEAEHARWRREKRALHDKIRKAGE